MQNHENDNVKTIIIQNNSSNALGIASFVFGVISIFFMAPLFVPLAIIFAILAIIKKQVAWGVTAIICSIIGFLTSPILLGLLGTFTFLSSAGTDISAEAQKLKAKKEIGDLSVKVEMYQADNGAFPDELDKLINDPGNAPRWRQYMKTLPKDPWGNDYRYRNPSIHGKAVDIYSIGVDQQEGTSDDIGSWSLYE